MVPFLLLSLAVAPPVFVIAMLIAAWKIHESSRFQRQLQNPQNPSKSVPQNEKYLTVPGAGLSNVVGHPLAKKQRNFDHFISLAFFFRSIFHLTHLPKIVINGPDKFVV